MKKASLLLILFFSGIASASVTIHGRLLVKNGTSFLIYQEGKVEKEIEVAHRLDDFRGQMVKLTGDIQRNVLIVKSALTDKNALFRGKRGRGFAGSGTVNLTAGGEPVFTPHLSKETLGEIKGFKMPMVLPPGMEKADRDFAVVDVVGAIVNGQIHIAPGFDGYRVRREEIEVQAGDTVVIHGKLFSGEVKDSDEWLTQSHIPFGGHVGEFRINADRLYVLYNDMDAPQPAFVNHALYGSAASPAIREFIEDNEEVKIVGKIDAAGHVLMEEVMPSFDPFSAPADVGIPETMDSAKCETDVTAGKGKPKLRLIKNEDEE